MWRERVHKLRVNTKTIHRVFREIGVPLLTKTPKRKPRQLKLFEKDAPGDSIQVDVKLIKLKREKCSTTPRSMIAPATACCVSTDA